MAFTDDFAIIGAAADNFDCDATGGWTAITGTGFESAAAVTLNTDSKEGTNALELRCGNTTAGLRGWYQDVTAGSRFKITEGTLNFWFSYSKGKGPNYLTTAASAIRLRLYFGGTTDWADYNLTNNGDEDLVFGYQLLQCSGTNLNGGGKSSAWTDYDREIHRVAILLDFASTNDSDSDDAGLLADCFFFGTEITVSEGTTGGTAATLQDLFDYSETGRVAFPLGLVALDEVFATLRCGLRIGNGSDGLNNEGYLKLTSSFLLFNQWSEEVKHNIIVEDFSQLDFGEAETLGSNIVAVRGCQVVLPANRFSDIDVRDGAIFKAYNSKFFRWRNLFLGIPSDTSSEVTLIDTTFDSCETVWLFSTMLTLSRCQVYNNSANIRDAAVAFYSEDTTFDDLLIHDCVEAIQLQRQATLSGVRCQDNTTLDVAIGDRLAFFSLLDSVFDVNKIAEVTADIPQFDIIAGQTQYNNDILFTGFTAPQPNALTLFAVAAITDTPANNVIPTVSGGGITTWAQVGSATIGTNQGRITLFRAQEAVPGAPAGITTDFGIGNTQNIITSCWVQIVGGIVAGNNGADAISESAVINDQAASASYTGSFVDAAVRNISFGVFAGRDTLSSEPGFVTPEDGYTIPINKFSGNSSSPTNRSLNLAIQFRIDGEDISVAGTWDRNRNYGGIVMEVITNFAD